VLRSLHSSEKRDIRAKVLPALIACTTETQRVWRQEVGDESSRARGSGRSRRAIRIEPLLVL
jgi:hypothetical protein